MEMRKLLVANGITELELQAIMEDEGNIAKLIELMKADGNEELVTDMRRTKSYIGGKNYR